MDFFAFRYLKHLLDYVTITDYEDLVLWPQDYICPHFANINAGMVT